VALGGGYPRRVPWPACGRPSKGARSCASSASTLSSTILPPPWWSTGRSSPQPRRSASRAASTARTRCRSPRGSSRSRPRAGAWSRRGWSRPTSTPSRTPTTPSSPRPPGGPHRAGVGGAAHAVRAPRAPVPADGTSGPRSRPGLVRGPPRGARRVGPPRLAPPLLRRARGGRPRRARVVSRGARPRRRLARGAGHAGAAALPRAHVRGAHRAPRLPALLGRVQGDGDGLLRAARVARRLPRARPRPPRRRLHGPADPLGALRRAARRGGGVAPRARRPGLHGPAAPRGGPRRPRAPAPRAHGGDGAHHGRRGRAQLRRQLPDLARDAVRARVGAAGVGRLGHGAGRRPAGGAGPRRRRAAHGHRGARAGLERR
jgi:hypothetical protein